MNLLEASVGLGGRNNPIDVALVQHLLKHCLTRCVRVKGRSVSVMEPGIAIDGECTPGLIEHIKKFQSTTLAVKNPDGRVDPVGKTIKHLAAHAAPVVAVSTAAAARMCLFGSTVGNNGLLKRVDPRRLRKLYIKQSGLGLTLTKGEDLLLFFNFLQNDPDIQDIRWAAYMLATVDRETGKSFKPIVEDGKGAGERYGKIESVTDLLGCRGPRNTVYQNAYYGRGYVQVTFKENYQSIGKALGVGDALYIDPDRLLDPEIAYFAASHGMRHGTYTGGIHKLSDHINGKRCNYKEARQIINGFNKADVIAENAEKIEVLLRLSVR